MARPRAVAALFAAGAAPALFVLFAVGAAPARAAASAPAVAATTGPQRVVTLAPHLTELVYAAGAGDRLVGTIDTSDHPAAALAIPRIGDVTRLDAERLLALHPDLVLAWGDGTPAEQFALVRRLGLRLLAIEQHTLADVPATIESLGRLFGTEAIAATAAARLRADTQALRKRYAADVPLNVFYQVWDAPLYTLGGRHLVSEMLATCGARNVFADEPASAFVVDVETVYARDPDAVVLAGTQAEADEWRARWVTRPGLRAVARGAVVRVDPDLVNRMGPRIVSGTAALCEALDTARRALAAHG